MITDYMTTDKSDEFRIKILEEDLKRVSHSYRFQIGDIAVETLQNPSTIFKQLKRLYKLFYEYTHSSALLRLRGSVEIGQPNDPIRALSPDNNIPIGRLLNLSKISVNRNRWANLNARTGKSNYERTLTKRLQELTELAKNGLTVKTQSSAKLAEESKHSIAMVLHNGLPLSVNGYAIRSQSLLDSLTNHNVNMKAFLRTTKQNLPEPYHAIGDVTPPDECLETYINTYSKLIEDTLRQHPPKLVHAASNYITGLAAGLAARRLGLPFIYEVRGLWEVTRASVHPGFEKSLGYAVQAKLETQCAIMADRVITLSTPLANTLVERGVEKKSIRVVPNGANISGLPSPETRAQARERFGASESDVIVGFIGSITPYEGLHTLIEAVSIARSKGAPLKLVIIGSGPTRVILEAQITRLGLRKHCRFLGQVSPIEATSLHAGLDIASYVRDITPVAKIVPPLKPLQAMAAHVATIVSDLPALVELVGGPNTKAAHICPANDPKALALILSHLAKHSQERLELAISGQNWVAKNRDWLTMAQNMNNIYSEILDT